MRKPEETRRREESWFAVACGSKGKQRTSVMMAADKHFSFLAQKPRSSSTWQLFAEQGRLSILFQSPSTTRPYVRWDVFWFELFFLLLLVGLFCFPLNRLVGWGGMDFFLLPFCTFCRVSSSPASALEFIPHKFCRRKKNLRSFLAWQGMNVALRRGAHDEWVGEKNWRSFSFAASRFGRWVQSNCDSQLVIAREDFFYGKHSKNRAKCKGRLVAAQHDVVVGTDYLNLDK